MAELFQADDCGCLGNAKLLADPRKQQILMERLDDHPALTVTYFVPDAKKSGGAYVTKGGNLKKIDGFERWMMLTDGTKIPLDDVADIESELFRDMF